MTLEGVKMTAENGHWMPIYWADYFADTTHLTTEEHGAYLLLIGAYWRRGNALPSDAAFLASVTKMTLRRFKLVSNKLSEMFVVLDGLWYHVRVEKEILRSSERLSSARANGRAGGLAKSYLSTITPTKEEISKKVLQFSLGKNGKQNEPLSEEQKLALFQKTLAESFPDIALGWRLVGEAADPQSSNHFIALKTCQLQARGLGKGWPHQWPK